MKIFQTADGRKHGFTFLLVCSMFLLSGLCNGLIDVLNKHFQNSLGVTKAQSALVQATWYGAYFLMAIPGGWFARRFGYRGGILTGLGIMLVGALLFVPVTGIQGTQTAIFASFLGTLFILGAGLTFLETVANPYATVLGSTEAAVARINLAQSCNAVGWIIGPILGAHFVLSKTETANTSNAALYQPYLLVALIVAMLFAVFIFAPVPDLEANSAGHLSEEERNDRHSLFKERHFVLALASQFLFVAAQTGIFGFFINYVKDPQFMPAVPGNIARLLPGDYTYLHEGSWRITEYCAGMMLSLAFVFFTIGRFSGSAIVRFARPHVTLGIYAAINVVLMAIVVLGIGWLSIASLVLSFLFMSIMYPTIFALGIRGLGIRTKLASSFMVTAIVGGAVMPMVMGKIASVMGMGIGFMVPLVCFVFIAAFGFSYGKQEISARPPPTTVL